MTVCNEIKRRIDEADDREALDHDIMRHTASCSDCRLFSVERASLRELIGSMGRVSAPMNFDAMLQARLAEAKTRRTPAWLNTAFYLRAGVATATLAAAVLVAQTSGFFTAPRNDSISQPGRNNQAVATSPATEQEAPAIEVNKAVASNTPPVVTPVDRIPVAVVGLSAHGGHHLRSATVNARAGTALPQVGYDLTGSDPVVVTDGGAVLIPGENGRRDIKLPTVSVGAQPLMLVNAGRQPQSAPTRHVPVSF
jgi:hypothetical protein